MKNKFQRKGAKTPSRLEIRKIANVLFCVLLLFLLGCSKAAQPQSQVGVFKGHYKFGFEVNDFQPCGSREKWWMEGEGTQLRSRMASFGKETTNTAYVEIRGELSPSGSYGHLGVYKHQLIISEVLTVRRPTPDDCK